jgi:hypothetical protein
MKITRRKRSKSRSTCKIKIRIRTEGSTALGVGAAGAARRSRNCLGDCVDGGIFWQDDWGRMIGADEGVLGLRIFYRWLIGRMGRCGGADWG